MLAPKDPIIVPYSSEYRSQLSKPEKKSYIKAVKCLHKKPARTPKEIAPGARSRYDDFVVTHILQTMSVHATVSLSINVAAIETKDLRATFSRGTATISMHTKQHCVTSADIQDIYHITIGRGGPRTQPNHLCSMGVKQVSLAMVLLFLVEMPRAFQEKIDAL